MKRLRRMLIARCEALLALSDRAYWLIMFSTLPFIIVGGFTHDQRIIVLAFLCQMVNLAMALARLLVALHHRKKAKGLHGQHRATPGDSRDHAGDVAAPVDTYRTISFTFPTSSVSSTAAIAADTASPGIAAPLPTRRGSEPIIGLRAWLVREVVHSPIATDSSASMQFVDFSRSSTRAHLESIVSSSIWMPGESMDGDVDKHRGDTSRYGVHAFSSWVTLCDFVHQFVENDVALSTRYRGFVLGSVALWGRVVVCERGYLASHAYPHTLVYASDGEEMLRDLGRRYGCETLYLSNVSPSTPLVTMDFKIFS